MTTVYSVAGKEPLTAASRAAEVAEMEAELIQGMRALIVGALALLDEGIPLERAAVAGGGVAAGCA